MSKLSEEILLLSHLRSTHIAEKLGCSDRYARRILKNNGLSHKVGPPSGKDNPAWVGGRMIDADGYALLKTKPQRVSEHRKVISDYLGRELLPGEVVDHINGITIHNDIENLRLFASNGEHLKATNTGKSQIMSKSGRKNSNRWASQHKDFQSVDIYRLRKKRGDVRLRAILRAALELGIKHPCLSGTRHWLQQIGIDPYSRPSLKRAWHELLNRYAEDLLL